MMERKHLHGITLLGGLAMALLCGCIRDELEPCPPLRLSLEVADKNYVNSAAAARLGYEEERPEDLPFREYVSDLAYRVSDLETGRVVAERMLSPVEGDAGSVEVPLPADLPYGAYVLTAWGNLGDTAAFDSDLALLGLHPGGAEGSDAYFTRDTLLVRHEALEGQADPGYREDARGVCLQRVEGIGYHEPFQCRGGLSRADDVGLRA